MNKLLGICIYRIDMIRGIINAINSNLCNIKIIGSKKKIIEICHVNNVNYKELDIIDLENYVDVSLKANELIETKEIDGIIFGDYPKDYIKNIITVENEVYILDLKEANHLLFVPNYLKHDFIDFEDKRKAIDCGKKIMMDLNINYYNIGIVSSDIYPSLKIERNLLNNFIELKKDNIDIINIKQVFKDDYNILIFNDRNSTNIFVESMLIHRENKFAQFMKSNNLFAIDTNKMTLQDLFFSLFLLDKITLYAKAS